MPRLVTTETTVLTEHISSNKDKESNDIARLQRQDARIRIPVPQAWLKLEIKSRQSRAGIRWRSGSVADIWPSKLATLCDEDSVNLRISLGK